MMIRKCKRCTKEFVPKKNQYFCSYICRIRTWRENNRDKIHKYKYDSVRRKPNLCKYCNKPIPNEARKIGKQLHSKCIGLQKIMIANKFNAMKEKLGCQICGYNHCGACIDFHHIYDGTKEKRILPSRWHWMRKDTLKELEKCITLCKNCHMEVHVFNPMLIGKRSI